MHRCLTMIVGAAFIAVACTPADDYDASDSTMADSPATAAADPSVTTTVRDTLGRELGTLTLTEAAGGISISGTLTGLSPGDHGMHLHMTGRCDTPTFESAGDHWNPTNMQHGTENPQGPHLGDMPNVTVGSDSTVTVQAITPGGILRGTGHVLLDADGAAVIIHASRDDLRTGPSGGSGTPVACGVISGT